MCLDGHCEVGKVTKSMQQNPWLKCLDIEASRRGER